MFIGVDVGGTNTDAVLMDGSQLMGAAKAPTTADVTSGIVAAGIAEAAGAESSRREAAGIVVLQVDAVMVGTTHFTNALLERRNLSPTRLVIRLCPARHISSYLPPLVDWIPRLSFFVQGCHRRLHLYGGRWA